MAAVDEKIAAVIAAANDLVKNHRSDLTRPEWLAVQDGLRGFEAARETRRQNAVGLADLRAKAAEMRRKPQPPRRTILEAL